MKTLELRNGDSLPMLGLGTWKSAPGEVGAAVTEALRLGYRHLDCAFIYGNEAEIGHALREAFEAGVAARDELWVTSKLWNDAHAPEDVRPALEKTLADLRLEALDLYLVHWPVAVRKGVFGPQEASDLRPLSEVPLAATWQAMEELVDAGLTRHIGVSNFGPRHLEELLTGARVAPEMNQVELHPYLQQDELLALCRSHGVHVTAYSPLGSRDRPATMKGQDEPVLLEDPTVTAIAVRHQATTAQVLIAWALQRGTAVIPKSVRPARLRENLAAAELELTAEDMDELAALDRGRRYVDGSFWAIPGSPYTLDDLWR
jgi:alcohol dehydrogenase (NADP+)